MKVVVCENCGAKYQLDDNDDINAFECSDCTGSLKEIESFADSTDSNFNAESSNESSNSVLVYCKNCGLKFQIDESDDINDFECASCQGPLDYVSNMTKDSTASQSQEAYYEDDYSTQYETDEIIPAHVDSDAVDEIIPAHADSAVDEIIPAHAESGVDEIIPIHAESNSESALEEYEDTYDDYYEEDDGDYYYESNLPDIEDLESSPSTFDETYYSDEYLAYDGVDEIIPIHAEKRYMETSRDIESGFAYDDEVYCEEEEPENNLVEITDIPEDELPVIPIPLTRQELSEEDRKLFDRVQNELVFDSPEEYEAFKAARYKYYVALLDILKEEYIVSLENELKANRSVKNMIKKGGSTVKQSKLHADESDALVSRETVEMMKSNNKYEPKKSNADIIILAGLFMTVVALAYYFFVSKIIYILIAVALGLVISAYGVYKKYTFNEYLARGRIIRERLLALPNDFYVFYAVQPPQSKDIINHVVVGPTGIFTILSKRYDSKDYKNKVKSDSETDAMVNESASIQDYRQRKNTLELQTDYDDNQSRFQFGNEEIHFTQNSQIKRKALELNEDLAIFLDKKGFNGIYIEPLIGFVNDDLAILNVILTNEDLFIDELFNKVIRGRRRLDELTVAKIARLLSYYSANCDVY